MASDRMLKDALREFLQFLKLNQNASPHTVRAYDTDLTQFLDHTAGMLELKPSQVPVRALDADTVRSFLDELYARGNSRASAARRLAAAPPMTGCRMRPVWAFTSTRWIPAA